MSWGKMRWTAGILCAIFSVTVHADDVGDAIASAGGSEFSIRAGDAIRVTCRDLAFQNAAGGLNTVQADLFGRCGDMVLTTLNVVGGNTGVANRYSLSSNEEVYATLRQFAGEETSSQGRFATEGSSGQASAISSRLAAIRSGVRVSSIALNVLGTDIIGLADGQDTTVGPLVGGNAGEAEGDLGFAWFGSVDYGFGDRDGSDNEDEYESDSYGVTIGLDYAFDNGLVLGLAGGYNDHEVDFDAVGLSAQVDPVSGGSMDIETWTLSGFFDHHSGPVYISGIFSYGDSEYDMERLIIVPASTAGSPVQNRRIVSDTSADQYAASVQVGRTFGQTATTYDIYGGFQYLDVDIDKYTETDLDGGSLGLAFGKQNIESRQWILGATVRHAMSTGAGVLVPYLSAEWHREISNDGRTVDARYALALGDVNGDGQSDNFALPTDDPDEDYFEMSLGLAGQLPNNIVLFFEYNALVGLQDTSASLITLGIRGTF
ncbi:MAG: autotransporter outer membrane beta-barrel domain-containing protein [Pseudomonadales bacterium]